MSLQVEKLEHNMAKLTIEAVSYTHLDVYKRQPGGLRKRAMMWKSWIIWKEMWPESRA